MPCDFVFRKDRGLVVAWFSGEVTDAEFIEYSETLASHPDFEAGLNLVVDVRSATSIRVSGEALSRAAALSKAQLKSLATTSTTIVLAPHTLPFGLSRMYEGLAAVADSPEEVKVFRTLEAAARSLELEPEDLETILAAGGRPGPR
jgi:hypothetical protein